MQVRCGLTELCVKQALDFLTAPQVLKPISVEALPKEDTMLAKFAALNEQDSLETKVAKVATLHGGHGRHPARRCQC